LSDEGRENDLDQERRGQERRKMLSGVSDNSENRNNFALDLSAINGQWIEVLINKKYILIRFLQLSLILVFRS
jgi:hypothetical protein